MDKELTPLEWLNYYKQKIIESNETFRPNGFDIIEKELKDFEWLKSILNIDFFDSLQAEDKVKLLNIMGVKIDYE